MVWLSNIGEWFTTIQNLVGLVIGALGGGFGLWIFNFYREKRIQDIAEDQAKHQHVIDINSQAAAILKDMVEGLRVDLEKMKTAYSAIENAYMLKNEENAKLNAELFILKNKDKPNING